MAKEITFLDLWKTVKKNLLKIMASIVLGVGLAYVFMTFLVTPSYQSSMQLLIYQQGAGQSEIQLGQIQSNVQLINTYRDIIGGTSVLAEVNNSLDEDYPIEALREAITVEQSPESQAFDITVTMESPEEAQDVLNALYIAFEDKVSDVYGAEETNINILSPATYNAEPVTPSLVIVLALGGILGGMAGFAYSFIKDLADTTVTDDEFRTNLGLIKLGQIDELSNKEAKDQEQGAAIITIAEPQSMYAEQFRTLRTNIDFVQAGQALRSLLVTSSIPSEGKSAVSANLAIVMGQTDKKVLLVDADLRKPTLHKVFRLNNRQGLSNLIATPNLAIEDVVQENTSLNVSFLTSGPIPPNPSELLSSAHMIGIMKELEQMYDLVIYDAPPINAVTDPQILASRVGGVLLVVRHGLVKKEEIREAKYNLDNIQANILGFVLNAQPYKKSNRYYKQYSYGSNYEEEMSP